MDLNELRKQILLCTVFEEIELREDIAYYFKLSDNYVHIYYDEEMRIFILNFKDKISVPPDFVTFSNMGGIEFIQIVEKTIDNFDIAFN